MHLNALRQLTTLNIGMMLIRSGTLIWILLQCNVCYGLLQTCYEIQVELPMPEQTNI